MAKKLSADLTATLKKLGIKAKTEEEAHDKLIAILEKNGIEGMEDESLTALIDMADAFLNDSEEEVEEEVEDDEVEETEDEVEVEADDDEEMDELADEVEANDAEAEEAKKEEKKAKKEEKKVEKKTTEKKQRKSSKNGVKLNPKVNVEDREALSFLREIFPENDYEFNWIAGGVTIKHIGKNSKRAVLSVYDLARKDDTIYFTLLFNTMTKEIEKLEELGLEYSVSNWTKQPFIKNVTPEYAKEVIGMLLETILGFIGKLDKRLGENRKKMEENLKKTEKKAAKKTEQFQETEDEVEEDEVEEVEESKKTTKKVTKKSKK